MHSLEELAYTRIREMILLGQAKSGDRLAERALATKVGVSRTPIRQAFSRLAREGLVSQVAGLGVIVNPIDPRDVEEIFELRGALEAVAAARAARRITSLQVQYLQHLCDDFFALTREVKKRGWRNWSEMDKEIQDALLNKDQAFHAYILRIADHRRVIQIFKDLDIFAFVFEKVPSGHEGTVVSSMVWAWRTHRRLLRALKARNSEAARAQVQEDTTLAMERLLQRLIREQATEATKLAWQ